MVQRDRQLPAHRLGESLLRQRVHNQRLDSASWQRPEEVIASLGAVQAQDYSGAKWAIGLRGATLTDAAVDAAFNAGTILRTHVLRPTWHFVMPADIRWLLALTGPRVQAFNRPYHRKLEIDAATLTKSNRTIERALAGTANQTRTELGAALNHAGIQFDGVRLALLMMHAELEAIVCSGPRRGRQFTYALLDVRSPGRNTLTRDEALAELTRRYFSSHGPATLRDFAWWSGLTVADVRSGVAMIRPGLEAITVDGTTYWFAASAHRLRTATAGPTTRHQRPRCHLLPNYDEFLIAYQDRELAIPRLDSAKPGATSAAFAHQVIVNGRLAGSWRRITKSASTIVEIAVNRPFTPADRRLVANAGRQFAAFLGTPVELIFVR